MAKTSNWMRNAVVLVAVVGLVAIGVQVFGPSEDIAGLATGKGASTASSVHSDFVEDAYGQLVTLQPSDGDLAVEVSKFSVVQASAFDSTLWSQVVDFATVRQIGLHADMVQDADGTSVASAITAEWLKPANKKQAPKEGPRTVEKDEISPEEKALRQELHHLTTRDGLDAMTIAEALDAIALIRPDLEGDVQAIESMVSYEVSVYLGGVEKTYRAAVSVVPGATEGAYTYYAADATMPGVLSYGLAKQAAFDVENPIEDVDEDAPLDEDNGADPIQNEECPPPSSKKDTKDGKEYHSTYFGLTYCYGKGTVQAECECVGTAPKCGCDSTADILERECSQNVWDIADGGLLFAHCQAQSSDTFESSANRGSCSASAGWGCVVSSCPLGFGAAGIGVTAGPVGVNFNVTGTALETWTAKAQASCACSEDQVIEAR